MTTHPTWTQDNVVSMSLIGAAVGQQIVNVLHFQQVSGTQDPAGAASFCDALAADWETNCKASWISLHSGDYTLSTIRTTPVAVSGLAHPALASHDRIVTAGGVSGNNASADLSSSLELKLRTLEGGKSHRGRIYVGPVPNNFPVADGWLSTVTSTTVPAFVTAMGRYIGAGAFAATGILGVFSRPIHLGEQQWTRRIAGTLTVRSNPAARSGDFTPVTTIVLDPTVREQRRREKGVGA